LRRTNLGGAGESVISQRFDAMFHGVVDDPVSGCRSRR
jgi:hypothetical protein